jgi:hypothetical protein
MLDRRRLVNHRPAKPLLGGQIANGDCHFHRSSEGLGNDTHMERILIVLLSSQMFNLKLQLGLTSELQDQDCQSTYQLTRHQSSSQNKITLDHKSCHFLPARTSSPQLTGLFDIM